MSKGWVFGFWLRWMARWLDRRGLGHVADSVDRISVAEGNVAAWHDMARRAMGRSQWAQAEELLRQAMALAPNDPQLLCSLGATYRRKGDFAAARSAYEQALAIRPDYPEVLSNLGEWCLANGQREEALDWLERALQVSPRLFQARINKTAVLFELGQYEPARTLAEQLVHDEPGSAEACLNLGNVLIHTGKAKQGIKQYKKALELQPDYPEAHFNLACLLGSQEDLAKAIGYLERRIEEHGDSVQNLGMLASARQAAGQLEKSEALCQRILERQPENLTALITLASCYSNSGNSDGAMALFKQVLACDPTQTAMNSNVLFEYNYVASATPQQVFQAHLDWAQRYETPLLPAADPFAAHNKDPHRRLRIGYVSGDFIRHPVGFLLKDILKHHDAARFSVHCFSMVIQPENVLPELRQAADTWEDIFFLSDEETVELIRKAEIDILVDLSGHTAFHRLLAFARRPAPVQAEWIGYFHSTGMASIDYFITDPHTSPPNGGQLFSETPVYLPHTRFCYGPPEYAPEVAPAPCIEKGFITFGSFNRLPKITDAVVAAWSAVLAQVPNSRLVIKSGALSENMVQERLRSRFLVHGIAADRLDLRENSRHAAMLGEYGDIDLALDTFPFNGGMTTLEALWMGVPVLTVVGNTVVSRQSVSALANLGLAEELAFADTATYIAGAVRLAHHPQRLAELRNQLRARMAASPLRDARQFTHELEALLRRMWTAWCQGEKLPSALNETVV